MTESTCRLMVRIGSLPGFLVTLAFFLLASDALKKVPGAHLLYSLLFAACLVVGGAILALSLLILKKQSRVAAVLISFPVLIAAAVLIMMCDGSDTSAVLFYAGGAALLVLLWLSGLIACFTWQSRYADKAEAVPPDRPVDQRPISEESRRMIEGSMSMLSNDIPIFEEDGDPTPDEKTKWGSGIFAPIGLLVWAGYALVTKHVIMHDDYFRAPVEIKGPAVYACALALISAALFLHFHYFWGQTPKLYDYYKIPKYTALAVLIVSAFAFFILAVSGS